MQHIWIFLCCCDISFPKAINVQHGFYFFPSKTVLPFPVLNPLAVVLSYCKQVRCQPAPLLGSGETVPGKVWQVNLSCVRKSEPGTAMPTCPKASSAALMGRGDLWHIFWPPLCGKGKDVSKAGWNEAFCLRQLQALKVKDSSMECLPWAYSKAPLTLGSAMEVAEGALSTQQALAG